jgi:hypothetical protein
VLCIVQYILCLINLIGYGFFVVYSLCMARGDSYDWKLKLLICGPLLTLSLTTLVATLHLVSTHEY